jgi:putative ABC transport system permease protein
MSALLYELRFSLRRLARDPLRSATSVIALMLGIALTASVFSVAYTILFRGMPYEDAAELLAVEQVSSESGERIRSLSSRDYLDLSEAETAFTHIGAWAPAAFDLADGEFRPERVRATALSPSFLRMLREAPRLGRGFEPDEVGPEARVALLSDRLWRERYAADPAVVGSTVRLDGQSFEVVGVMRPGFHYPNNQDVFVPLPEDPRMAAPGEAPVQVVGRLPSEVDPRAAIAQLEALFQRTHEVSGAGGEAPEAALIPLIKSHLGAEEEALLWAMIMGSLLVLAIACLNVTNLLSAVAASRSSDLAVAAVLGATRSRLLTQLLLDAAVLSFTGGVLGILLTTRLVEWFDVTLGGQKPVWMVFEVDGPILLFALGTCLAAALLTGLAPALRSAGVSLRRAIQEETRGGGGRRLGAFNHAMVVATMALSYPLLAGAGLLIASYGAWSSDLPFDGSRTLVAQVTLPDWSYADSAQRTTFVDEVIDWAENEGTFESATWSDVVPSLGATRDRFAIEGQPYIQPEDQPRARLVLARPGFFGAMGVEPTEGRAFDARDRTGPPNAIVNESFVARHFPSSDPLGARIRVVGEEEPWRTIVGVVPDLRLNGTERVTPEGIYLPSPPADPASGYFLFQAVADPSSAAGALRRGFETLDATLPIQALETLDARVDRTYWILTVAGPVFTTFGLAALFLASVGLFGVVAHSVTQRRREFGIRIALGATGGSVVTDVVRSGIVQALLGAVLGSTLAFGGAGLLAGILYGVRPLEPGILLGVGAVLLTAAMVASALPASRVLRSPVLDALRGP